MTSDREIIDDLYKYGHFKGRVLRRDLRKLTLSDKETVEALKSYQYLLGPSLDQLTQKHHFGRVSAPDGIVGPATRELFRLPRCEMPDFGMGASPVGSGSWPMPCQKAGIKVHINKSRMPSGIVAQWPDIQEKVFAAYRLMGGNLIEVSNAADAHILVSFRAFLFSTIGLARYNNESCNDRVTCEMSSSYIGHNGGLFKHELGHCFNLGHTRGGTMHPSILPEVDPLYRWLPSDPSYNTLVRFLGGTPIDPLPGPGPGPGPDPVPAPSNPLCEFLHGLLGIK